MIYVIRRSQYGFIEVGYQPSQSDKNENISLTQKQYFIEISDIIRRRNVLPRYESICSGNVEVAQILALSNTCNRRKEIEAQNLVTRYFYLPLLTPPPSSSIHFVPIFCNQLSGFAFL